MRRYWTGVLLLLVALPSFAAKDKPAFQTILWPESGPSVLRLSFSKFNELSGGVGKERAFVTEATAENLSGKVLGSVNLSLYVFDKAHARIGDGNISLTNVGVKEVVKFQMTLYATGTPMSLAVATGTPQALSITINSTPQGATVKLDGKELGTTPKLAEVTLGKHILEFSKEGYTTGRFPLEMGPRDVSGGNVTYELGTSAHDTVELRDGSVLSGDLLSMDATQVQFRIGGAIQTYSRNQIKRISLTQREAVAP